MKHTHIKLLLHSTLCLFLYSSPPIPPLPTLPLIFLFLPYCKNLRLVTFNVLMLTLFYSCSASTITLLSTLPFPLLFISYHKNFRWTLLLMFQCSFMLPMLLQRKERPLLTTIHVYYNNYPTLPPCLPLSFSLPLFPQILPSSSSPVHLLNPPQWTPVKVAPTWSSKRPCPSRCVQIVWAWRRAQPQERRHLGWGNASSQDSGWHRERRAASGQLPPAPRMFLTFTDRSE